MSDAHAHHEAENQLALFYRVVQIIRHDVGGHMLPSRKLLEKLDQDDVDPDVRRLVRQTCALVESFTENLEFLRAIQPPAAPCDDGQVDVAEWWAEYGRILQALTAPSLRVRWRVPQAPLHISISPQALFHLLAFLLLDVAACQKAKVEQVEFAWHAIDRDTAELQIAGECWTSFSTDASLQQFLQQYGLENYKPKAAGDAEGCCIHFTRIAAE